MAVKINCIKVVTEFVDDTTGEIFSEERILGEETKKTKSTSTRTKKPKDDGDPTPKVTLLDNKLQLNKAAIELTGFEPEMKIDVKFEKKGRTITPVMCQDDKTGNRLTKTYTVSFRGSRHDNLIEYGTVFELSSYDGKEGYFKLKGDAPEKEDDIIDVPEEINDPEEIGEDLGLEEGNEIGDVNFDLDL